MYVVFDARSYLTIGIFHRRSKAKLCAFEIGSAVILKCNNKKRIKNFIWNASKVAGFIRDYEKEMESTERICNG